MKSSTSTVNTLWFAPTTKALRSHASAEAAISVIRQAVWYETKSKASFEFTHARMLARVTTWLRSRIAFLG